MKVKIPTTKEIDVVAIRLRLPVPSDAEHIANDFPLRKGKLWIGTVEMDTGKILDWPDNPRFQECNLIMKVCDEGTYTLLAADGSKVAEIREGYVPNRVVPGAYGDYVDLKIKNGVITNWPKAPYLWHFFKKGDDE